MNRHIDMLRSSIPFLGGRQREFVEALIEATKLHALLGGSGERTDLTVCTPDQTTDLPGLLGAIRNFASPKERQMIDMISNFLMVKQMKEMMDMMQWARGDGNEKGEDVDMMSLLRGMMPDDQAQQIDLIMSMMSMMGDPKEK